MKQLFRETKSHLNMIIYMLKQGHEEGRTIARQHAEAALTLLEKAYPAAKSIKIKEST